MSSADFTVDDERRLFRMGKPRCLSGPRHLRPATSGYARVLDKDCEVLRGHVNIHADCASRRSGVDRLLARAAIQAVVLVVDWVLDLHAHGRGGFADVRCPSCGRRRSALPGIDESLDDARLRTSSARGRYAYRRIRHFSATT